MRRLFFSALDSLWLGSAYVEELSIDAGEVRNLDKISDPIASPKGKGGENGFLGELDNFFERKRLSTFKEGNCKARISRASSR